VDQFSFYLY